MKDAFGICRNGHRQYITATQHHVQCQICGEIVRRPEHQAIKDNEEIWRRTPSGTLYRDRRSSHGI